MESHLMRWSVAEKRSQYAEVCIMSEDEVVEESPDEPVVEDTPPQPIAGINQQRGGRNNR